MADEPISEVKIDEAGRLLLHPSKSSFDDLHMAGAWGFRWDQSAGCLASPKPLEWTYAQWFAHIVEIIASQYGTSLIIEPGTAWTSVPDEVRWEIEKRSSEA
jgi:hypothetical protein